MMSGTCHEIIGKFKQNEERNRVLTMKYGKQQMMLIRKRMKIENWIDAEVAKLFNGNDNNVSYDGTAVLFKHLIKNLNGERC
ncbi:hypothetical protein ANCDUO_20390 [Ancylostoma duodenale]|uniref:Uncharacterized protein n=1 Tax=Ancylostoma duodenale TaxID=51022 RepID=A0A0C2FLR1_9BILA|nr:hypothetical protein ANCDUO_20390 [Ancylostoma duodenale]